MDNKSPLISYALATLSGICFVSGLAMLSDKGGKALCTSLEKFYQ